MSHGIDSGDGSMLKTGVSCSAVHHGERLQGRIDLENLRWIETFANVTFVEVMYMSPSCI